MNVYIHIDQSWSYRFLTKYKKIIAEYDFFIFSDSFLSTGINTLKAYVNYQYNRDSTEYASTMHQVEHLCDAYPELGHHIKTAYNDLLMTHMDALKAIGGQITNYQPIIDDSYLLTGILFTVVIESDLKPILQW